MTKRKAIPKDVRDQVLVAAMHRCCLCPDHEDVVDLHHVIQISEGGPNTEDNLIAVCPTCHAKIHRIRNRYNVAQLGMYKERWVQLCALGLPLDARMARAYDTRQSPPQMPSGIPLLSVPHFAHPYPLQENFSGRVAEREMLTQWWTGGERPIMAVTALGGMGKSALTALSRLDEADTHLTQALSRCRRINLVEMEPDILLAWARWHFTLSRVEGRDKGSRDEARRYAEEALAIADRCEYRLKQAEIHNFFAGWHLDEGDTAQALHHAEIAKERAWGDGPPHCYQSALDEAERWLTEIASAG